MQRKNNKKIVKRRSIQDISKLLSCIMFIFFVVSEFMNIEMIVLIYKL